MLAVRKEYVAPKSLLHGVQQSLSWSADALPYAPHLNSACIQMFVVQNQRGANSSAWMMVQIHMLRVLLWGLCAQGNAAILRKAFMDMGFSVYGGEDAPYVWVGFPGKASWCGGGGCGGGRWAVRGLSRAVAGLWENG